ncbi:MAG TPA: flagellar hook capping FlgD N-terminal domain-containing protein [Nocardioides sp.]|nr:flagellar hook capping FlgD N-terminal domain-containing protein [Nocardioides sp.]
MSVTPTEGVSSGLMAPVAATSAGNTDALGDQQTFLELMVAQLRYQDPMNPTDSSEFLSQTAQFTALQKMQDVADQTAMLLTAQLSFGASSLIGKTVHWMDENGAEQTGTVQGTTFLPSGPMLSVDGHEVPVMSVVSVGDAPTIQAPATSGSAGDPPQGLPPA